MATGTVFNQALESLVEAVINLGSDTLNVALSDVAPVATDTDLGDITEIAAGSGYSSGGSAITVSSSGQASGVYKLVCTNLTFTASGGDIGPFRYAVLYSVTAGNKLIAWWDLGQEITILDGNSYTLKPSATNGILKMVKA